VLDPSGFVVAPGAGNDALANDVAFDGTDFLVVYTDRTGGKPDYDVTAVRVAPDGTAGTPFPVRTAPGFQGNASVASTGTGQSLVVWEDWSVPEHLASTGNLYSSRVDHTGALDPAGVVVSAEAYGQNDPSVAWNGQRYLVAWNDGRESSGEFIFDVVYASRVTVDNTVQDPAGIPIRSSDVSSSPPAVAANGGTFLVVWNRRDDVLATRVNDAGGLQDGGGFVVADGDPTNGQPAVTAGPGSTWGTVYSRSDFFGGIEGQIRMRTVAPK